LTGAKGIPLLADPAARKPIVGPLLIALGTVHIGLTPVLYPRSVRSILDGSVIASVEADPAKAELRGLAFWYTTSGAALIAFGIAVTERERHSRPLPASLPSALTALGAWGVLLMPKSPFWVFPLLAAVAAARRHAALRSRSA
jgi:hypothetical protein